MAFTPLPMHPAVEPVVIALRSLRAYQPADQADLAEVLRSLNNSSEPDTIIDNLYYLLHGLAEWHNTAEGYDTDADPDTQTTVALHLHEAANTISGAGMDRIDRAHPLLPKP